MKPSEYIMEFLKDYKGLVNYFDELDKKFISIEEVKKIIDERKKYYEKLWLKAHDENNKHFEDSCYQTKIELQELKNKTTRC